MANRTQQNGFIAMEEKSQLQTSASGLRCGNCGDAFSSGEDLKSHKVHCSEEVFCLCHHTERKYFVGSS